MHWIANALSLNELSIKFLEGRKEKTEYMNNVIEERLNTTLNTA